MRSYDEFVTPTGSFRWAVTAAGALTLVAALLSLRSAREPVLTLILAPVGALLMALGWWAMTLRLRLDEEALRVRLGPFHTRLDRAKIAGAHAERYPWARFGGWGLRRAWRHPLRDRAWSVPFRRDCVVVELRDGARYFLSTRRPQTLLAALEPAGAGVVPAAERVG